MNSALFSSGSTSGKSAWFSSRASCCSSRTEDNAGKKSTDLVNACKVRAWAPGCAYLGDGKLCKEDDGKIKKSKRRRTAFLHINEAIVGKFPN